LAQYVNKFLVRHKKFGPAQDILRPVKGQGIRAVCNQERVMMAHIRYLDLLLPCPFTGPKMFCVGPNFLSQPQNLTAFSASSKTFVPAQKPILLNANHLFVWHKMFVTATICKYIFGLAQKIWTSPKHFGTCKRTRHLIQVL
jgi:hypothetical protein